MIENYDSLVYDLTQTSVDSLISGAQVEVEKYRPNLNLESSLFQDKPEVDPNAPVPSVEVSGMTNDGLLTIRFSTPMDLPDLGDLSRSQVALRVTKAVDYEEYRTENGFGTFETRDGIEISMQPSN